MAGLNLMGSIGTFQNSGTQPSADTASEAAFGPNPSGGGSKALAPTHPMGIALWGGWAALGGLAFLYHSLPADRRSEMELVLLTVVLFQAAKAPAKMSLQRLAQEGKTQGIIDSLARAGLWLLS